MAMKNVLRALGLLLALAAQPAAAQSGPAPAAARPLLLAQGESRGAQRLTLDEATQTVQRSTGARVLSAQAARQDGREGYRIKVLTASGEVRIFFVDAGSGALRQD